MLCRTKTLQCYSDFQTAAGLLVMLLFIFFYINWLNLLGLIRVSWLGHVFKMSLWEIFGLYISCYSCLLESDRISFSFSVPKMLTFDGFGHFRFRPKTILRFRFRWKRRTKRPKFTIFKQRLLTSTKRSPDCLQTVVNGYYDIDNEIIIARTTVDADVI